jgi:hypothetical protein
MHIEDRMITRARHLQTPLPRLQELAPRLLAMLPNTIGACTERLSATRQEIQDTAEFLLDQVADRGGCLVRRDRHLAAFDARDDFYVARQTR